MKNGYVKITFEDADIARKFFENDKHFDEFLSQVCRYYLEIENVFKYKNVKKYFETYRKTMDKVKLARNCGAIGGLQRSENQKVAEKTLEGTLLAPLEGTLQGTPLPKLINIKEIEIYKNSLMCTFDTSACSEDFVRSYTIAESFRKKFLKIIQEKGGSIEKLNKAKVGAWVEPIIALEKTDKVSIDKIREVYKEFGNLDFWTGIISSTSGVRKNFNKLVMAVDKLKPNQKVVSSDMTDAEKNKLLRQQMGI